MICHKASVGFFFFILFYRSVSFSFFFLKKLIFFSLSFFPSLFLITYLRHTFSFSSIIYSLCFFLPIHISPLSLPSNLISDSLPPSFCLHNALLSAFSQFSPSTYNSLQMLGPGFKWWRILAPHSPPLHQLQLNCQSVRCILNSPRHIAPILLPYASPNSLLFLKPYTSQDGHLVWRYSRQRRHLPCRLFHQYLFSTIYLFPLLLFIYIYLLFSLPSFFF